MFYHMRVICTVEVNHRNFGSSRKSSSSVQLKHIGPPRRALIPGTKTSPAFYLIRLYISLIWCIVINPISLDQPRRLVARIVTISHS